MQILPQMQYSICLAIFNETGLANTDDLYLADTDTHLIDYQYEYANTFITGACVWLKTFKHSFTIPWHMVIFVFITLVLVDAQLIKYNSNI